MTNGYILLTDELDAGRPDALYALQEVFENRPKRLLEDGGRMIPYHPMTRIVATGNTAGNGDPSGLYPACRILSAATLDRFQTFIEIPYLTTEQEMTLLERKTGLSKTIRNRLAKFSTEMRESFKRGEIPISYSPRRSIAFAKAVEDYMNIANLPFDAAASLAIQEKVVDPAPVEFRQRVMEIAGAALGNVNVTVDI
jgi:cobaltochelatase CobS